MELPVQFVYTENGIKKTSVDDELPNSRLKSRVCGSSSSN